MTVSLRDARANPVDQQWIGSAYRDYLDDLGQMNTGVFPVLGEFGHREPDHLQRWLVDRAALLITILDNLQPVGFAMIVREVDATHRSSYRMAEFFVDRRHRRRGVGSNAVRLIFDRFAGRWEVSEHARNPGAVSFWRRTVAAYTRGDFRERTLNGEVHQYFSSSNPRGQPG